MKKSTILELLQGEFDAYSLSPQLLKQRTEAIAKLVEILKGKLGDDQNETIDKLIDTILDYTGVEIDYFLVEGFKAGVLVVAECID